jgi:hypothetical protein
LLQVQVNDPCNGKQETAHAQDMKNGDEEEKTLPAEPLKDSSTSADRAAFPESNPARLQKLSRHLSWACLFLGAIQRRTTITSFKHHSSCGSAIKWTPLFAINAVMFKFANHEDLFDGWGLISGPLHERRDCFGAL